MPSSMRRLGYGSKHSGRIRAACIASRPTSNSAAGSAHTPRVCAYGATRYRRTPGRERLSRL
jgi:hypothetical protein